MHDNKLYTASQLLAVYNQELDVMLSQLAPTDVPIGGSLVVLIPTDEFFAQVSGANSGSRTGIVRNWSDLQFQLFRNQLMTMIEAVRKRALFETVEWRQSVDPEQEVFKTDFALIRPAKKDADWLLRARTRTTHDAIPVALGPSSLSRLQWIMVWLDNIEEAAKEAKEQ